MLLLVMDVAILVGSTLREDSSDPSHKVHRKPSSIE